MAVSMLKSNRVSRIVLVRPAVEAGERLGFLPGDVNDKLDPYMRPLYDALGDMVKNDMLKRLTEDGTIEIAPLAFMRGRTMHEAVVILDEAQNATQNQMLMFLTRMGFDSKAVITGDITQSDLPGGKPLGLLQAQDLLTDITGIKFVYLSGSDVVRHEIVQRIIEAYDKASSSHGK